MTNKGLDMSINDQDRCRSLVCDPNGIIVAEMVYRCMICFYVSDTMPEARQHYVLKHIEEDDLSNENCVDQCDDLDDLRQSTKNIPKHLNKKLQQQNNNNSNKYQNGNRSNSLDNGIDSYSPINVSNKYRNGSAEPIDMSPSSDSFDRYTPLVTISDGLDSATNGGKSGYVNCAVCNVTRFYSCVQRRYGQFTCVTCYRFVKQFFDKPERHSCPQLGKCLLNVRIRCKACWIKACTDLFQVDPEKQQLLDTYAPIKQHGGASTSSVNNSEEDDEHLDHLDGLDSSSLADDRMDHSDDNNNSINNGLNGQMNHSKEALSMMLALNGLHDLPNQFSKSSLNNFGLLTGNGNNLFGNLNDNNNNSLITSNTNSINGLSSSQQSALNNLANGNDSSGLPFLTPKRNNHMNNKHQDLNGTNLSVDSLKSSLESSILNGSTKDSNNNNKSNSTANGNNKPTKGTAGKKVWSCGKCSTCVAEDCGKCIYCLDRPKFGGPFVKKQRCIKRRCLMKIKTKNANKANNSTGNVSATNLSTNTSTFVF